MAAGRASCVFPGCAFAQRGTEPWNDERTIAVERLGCALGKADWILLASCFSWSRGLLAAEHVGCDVIGLFTSEFHVSL